MTDPNIINRPADTGDQLSQAILASEVLDDLDANIELIDELLKERTRR